jgi:hypothetical protein
LHAAAALACRWVQGQLQGLLLLLLLLLQLLLHKTAC